MKRRWEEMDKCKSMARLALEELSLFVASTSMESSSSGSTTMALLCASNHLLLVLDEIGPRLLVLRNDIQKNVERIQKLHARNPVKYSSLLAIVKREDEDGSTRKADSCSRAIVWLSRSVSFSVAILEKLVENPELGLEEAVEEAYAKTLKPWHGWISSAAYKVALKLIPGREVLVGILMGQCQDWEGFKEDARLLIKAMEPLLDETVSLQAKYQLEKLKSS